MCGGEAALCGIPRAFLGIKLHHADFTGSILRFTQSKTSKYMHSTSLFFSSPQFIFEFLKGAGPKGSIAIDDMHIIPGPCDSYPTSPPHTTVTVSI